MQALSNRFDLLRLVFAALVAVYHAITLPGLWAGTSWEQAWALLAELSIQGFFIISGALVFGSWGRSDSIADYTSKRIRRLYPAYLVVILVPALIALGMTGAWAGVARYVAANAIFLNFLAPDLPGVFESQRFTAVNGALWTLKIEVMFYMALPVIAVVLNWAKRWKLWLLLALYAAAEIWRIAWLSSGDPYHAMIARQLPGQMSFFAVGMAMRLMWDRAKAAPLWLALIGAGLVAVSISVDVAAPLRAIGLGLVIAPLAFAKGPMPNAARFGDISYGVYIVHFPVVQVLIAAGLFQLNLWPGFAAASVLVVMLSYALWHGVEKHALRPSSHYRKAANAS